MSFDRDAATARLRDLPTDELLEVLAAQDTAEWEPEVFTIARGLLAERGVDVEAALAARPPRTPEDHTPDDLTIVATFGMVPDAEPCRAAMEAAGFDVFLLDENAINVDPALWPMLKGVKLAVPQSQVEEAREFLAAADRGELAQGSPETALQCPACGSSNVTFSSNAAARFNAGMGFGGVLALGGALTPRSDAHYECADCGARS